MATMTTSNISTLNFMMGTSVDESSLKSSTQKIQHALEGMTIGKEMAHAQMIADGKMQQSQTQLSQMGDYYRLQEAAAAAKEAAFQKEFSNLLKLEAAQTRTIAQEMAHEQMIADARRQHGQTQLSQMGEYYRAMESAGAAQKAEISSRNQELAASRSAWETDEKAKRNAAASLANQRAEAIRGIEAESAAEQRANARWLTMQAARRNADPYAGGSSYTPTADRYAEQAAREQAENTARIISQVRQQQYEVEATARAAAENKAAVTIATVRKQQMQALRRQERENIADAQTGVTILQRVQQTAHEKRMRQLLDEDDVITGGGGGRMSAAQRAAQARNAASHMAGQGGKWGTRIQELGRGFEDFAVSFSMAKTTSEGIAMGLRGSANNAAQLASSFNPLVGAAVAVGASLATIIIPQSIKWLATMYETHKELKDYMDDIDKLADKEERRAKAQIDARNIKGGEELESKKKNLQEELEVQERRITEIAKHHKSAQKELDKATENEKKWAEENQNWWQAKGIRSLERYFRGESGQSARAEERTKGIEAEQLKEQEKLAEIHKNMRLVEAEEGRVLAEDNAKHEDEHKQWVYDQSEQRRLKEVKAMDEKYKFMEAAEKQFLDDQITSQTESIDILQERIQKAGNAAGPSAAFVTGTQAAESAINRAISGTRSVEDTMKAQLKVQQDMLKALNKQKNQLTTKAI